MEHFGERPEPGGWYSPDDWHRISFVLSCMEPGGNVLDVGVGAGQFLNALAMSGRFTGVTGLDKTRFKKYREFAEGICQMNGSVADLPFEDDSFDVVTCMEVLEHLPEEIYQTGLAELRRVCRGQLLMTVPYCEPKPIYVGHRRRYEDIDIVRTFPDGVRTILKRPGMSWMLVEERFDNRPALTAKLRAHGTARTQSRFDTPVRSSSFGATLQAVPRRIKRLLRL